MKKSTTHKKERKSLTNFTTLVQVAGPIHSQAWIPQSIAKAGLSVPPELI